MNLTIKETNALFAITRQALIGMGGDNPCDLYDDNYSWFNSSDIATYAKISIESAKGLMSSLERKSMIEHHDPDQEFGWIISHNGIEYMIEFYRYNERKLKCID